MRKKIVVICILSSLLFAGVATFTTQGEKISEPLTNESDLFSQDNTDNELYPLTYNAIDKFGNIINVDYSRNNLDNSLSINNPSNHKLILEPPWDNYKAKEAKDKWGASDCWAENTENNGEYGKTTIHAWTGPGAGYASISMSLMHYDGFRPPKDSDYSFTYKFHQEGNINLNSMYGVLGSSAARGGVNFYFYLWDGETISFEKSMTVKEQYSVGGVGNGDFPYSLTKSYSNSAHLQKGVSYTFGANGRPWGVCDGFVIAAGFADQSVDWAGLQKLEIEWPNSPPDTPELFAPSNGATGISRTPTLQWTCDDPDGEYETLKYDVYLGKSSSPPKVYSGQSSTSYKSGLLDGETTYYWKIVVKDGQGETKTSPVWKFSTEKESLSNDATSKSQLSKGILDFDDYPITGVVKRLFELFDKKLSNLLIS